jgi:hypothetical protein
VEVIRHNGIGGNIDTKQLGKLNKPGHNRIASVAEIFAIDNTKQKCAAHTAANVVIIGRSI